MTLTIHHQFIHKLNLRCPIYAYERITFLTKYVPRCCLFTINQSSEVRFTTLMVFSKDVSQISVETSENACAVFVA